MIVIPSQWPKQLPAKLAFVGEAPSWEEERTKVPFTGPSGRMFNSMLRAAGIDREQCFVTNVFNEKLPDNEVSNICMPLKEARALGATKLPPIGDSGFLRPEYYGHLDRLSEELQKCQANVIVPLGGTALWAFAGNSNVGGVRGTILAAQRVVPGAKVVPTYHPSFVQKQFKYYSVVVGDLQKAAQESERGASIIVPKRELHIEPTIPFLHSVRDRLLDTQLLSVDIETGWGQITCIGFSPSPEYAVVVPFLDRRNINRSYWRTAEEEADAWEFVRAVCASPVPKLGQNFSAYDLYWLLMQYNVAVRNLQEDTRLMHHALFAELPKSLEFMQGYGTQGAWKHMGKHKEKRDD